MNISTLYSLTTKEVRIVRAPSLFLLVFLLMTSNLFGAGVSLTWNKNDESDLAGYHIYQRLTTSIEYGSPTFSGLPSNPSAPQRTINNLLAGTTYGFIATAYDSSGNESSISNEFIVKTLDSEQGEGNVEESSGSNTEGNTGNTNNALVSISSPSPGSTLSKTTVTFIGGHQTGNVSHSLWVGTTKGTRNLFSGPMSNHSQTVTGLPHQGTIYVRYWSTNSNDNSDPNAWSFTDQVYALAANSEKPPSVSTPSVNIPSVNTPAVSIPSVNTPAVSTPPTNTLQAKNPPNSIPPVTLAQDNSIISTTVDPKQLVAKAKEEQRLVVAKAKEQIKLAKAMAKEQIKLAKTTAKEQIKLAKTEKKRLLALAKTKEERLVVKANAKDQIKLAKSEKKRQLALAKEKKKRAKAMAKEEIQSAKLKAKEQIKLAKTNAKD